VDNLAKLVADKDLVPGKPGDSPLVQRMALPANDSDHMPPPEKPQADAWEIAAVSAWVASGGAADSVVAANDLPASVVKALNLPASPVVAAAPGSVVPLRASGCGSCAIGSRPPGSTFALGIATVLGLALGLGARRRRRASISR
jgi:MYXO-CTERM domain-containing protein